MKNTLWTKRRLGRTEMQVTPLGLGGAWLGHNGQRGQPLDEEVAVQTVLRALDLGINLIDTSPAYLRRESERFIGIALQTWYQRGGRREDLILSTKTNTHVRPPDYSAEATRQSLVESLALLKTDYLDVVLIHDPRDLTPVLAPGGALEALLDFKAQGVIRAIGLGVRSHEFHRRCIQSGDFDVSLTFRDFNLLEQSAREDIFEVAATHDVGIFNASPTLNGLLGGGEPLALLRAAQAEGRRLWGAYEEEAHRAQTFWAWAQARDISLLALNLQYCLRDPRVATVLVGASEPAQIEADVAALADPIPESIWDALHEDFGI